MAVPKRKVSKGRRGRRRAHHAIGIPKLVRCPRCGERIMPHRVCPFCGTYMGRLEVIEIEEE